MARLVLNQIPAASRIQASSYNDVSGLQTQTTSDVDGGYNLGFSVNGSYVRYKSIDFGAGVIGVEARVANAGVTRNGSTIEFRLDSLSGPLIASVAVPDTGGFQNWTTVSGTSTGASGTHDVYVVFKGDGINGNLNWVPVPQLVVKPEPNRETVLLSMRQTKGTSAASGRGLVGSPIDAALLQDTFAPQVSGIVPLPGAIAPTKPVDPDVAWPSEYRGVYQARRRECGWGLYESLGIGKGDRAASAAQAAENFRMFGAPHVYPGEVSVVSSRGAEKVLAFSGSSVSLADSDLAQAIILATELLASAGTEPLPPSATGPSGDPLPAAGVSSPPPPHALSNRPASSTAATPEVVRMLRLVIDMMVAPWPSC